MSDLERIVSAADRIESAAHRMAILFEDGYGGNGVRLLEVMETDVVALRAKLQAAEAEVARLKGITPELPPCPPMGAGTPRYGIRWNGPTAPLAVPMDDGYWTPWHLADHLQAEVARLREVLEQIMSKPDHGLVDMEDVHDIARAALEVKP